MTRVEPRTQASSASSWRWWVLSASMLAVGVAVGVAAARIHGQHNAATDNPFASTAPADAFSLDEWQYPGAKSLAAVDGASAGSRNPDRATGVSLPGVYCSATPDSIDLVWAHYTRLAGAEEKQLRAGSSGGFSHITTSSAGGSDLSGSFASYTGDPDRKPVRSAAIVMQRRAFSVAVSLSRAEGDDRTYIDMFVQRMPVLHQIPSAWPWRQGPCRDFDVESDPQRLTTLMAKVPAEAIHGALQSRGYRIAADAPQDGDLGWHFTVEIGGRTFGVFTLSAWIAEQDYFAVQTDLKRGVFAALFRKPVKDERLKPMCRALDETFAMLPRVKDLQWLSDAQFAASYCRGEPLPAAAGRDE